MHAMIAVENARTRMGSAWMNPEFRFGLMNVPSNFNTHMDPNTMWQIGLAQQIPFPGKLRASQRTGEFRTQAAAASYDEARYRMAGMVAESYYDLAAAIKIRQLLHQGASLAADMTAAASAQLAAGMGTQSEVLRSRVEEENWNVKLANNLADIERKRAALAYAVGRTGPTILTDPVLPDSLPPDIITDAVLDSVTLAATPSMKRAALDAAAARADVNQARLDYYPDVEVMASVGIRGYLRVSGQNPHTGEPFSGRVPQDKMVSLEVSAPLPLYFRGNQSAKVDELRAMQHGRELDLARARLEKQQELLELAARWKQSVDCCRIEQGKVVPQVRDTWRAMLNDYRSGKASFASLADAQMKLVMAEMDVIMHKADGWIAYRQWQAALGESDFISGENSK
jgi:outer membrane protein, heavy metal efflux system